MRVIAKRTLRSFWEKPNCEDSQAPLEAWHDVVLKADWKSPQDVKEQFRNASICANNRVVFNIGGNKYRLVVEIQYRVGIVWVKFLGTHVEYDQIDVGTANEY
jgi:mRNA interferase HigB